MPRATRSTESHCSFPLQQCLPEAGPNQHCHPSPWHPGGCLGHLPRRPSAPHRCAQATTRTPGPPSTGRSTWRSLPPASPWPCLAALILTVWLRRICPISPSAVSREQRIRWDTDEATNQQGGWIPNSSGYQEAKPGGLGRRNTAEHVLLLKSTWGNSTSWLLTNNTCLGYFPETHYLKEQMKSKDLGDHNTSVHKMGPRESGTAEDLSDKHTLGDSDPESWAPAWLPTATGPLSRSLRLCMHVGVTVTFSISWTKTSTWALSFALVLQIKQWGDPPKRLSSSPN